MTLNYIVRSLALCPICEDLWADVAYTFSLTLHTQYTKHIDVLLCFWGEEPRLNIGASSRRILNPEVSLPVAVPGELPFVVASQAESIRLRLHRSKHFSPKYLINLESYL